MAFDEDFHMGLIKIYASSWLPYGIEHTRDMATYGAATADASYLWHYILSFPYRLMGLLGWNERVVVTVLRIVNVATAVASLFVYRKVLIEARMGKATSNFTIALFTLIPILPILAGQVNYDNPLLLLIGLTFLLALRWYKDFKETGNIPIKQTYLLIIVVLFASPIKYTYLPIAAGVAMWLVAILIINRKKIAWHKQWRHLTKQTKSLPAQIKLLGIILFLLGSFFSAHYATNYFTYGSLTPSCDEVFDDQACLNYGPWNRNRYLSQHLSPDFHPVSFREYLVGIWIPDMAERLTFAVAGPTNDYDTKEPLPNLLGSLAILCGIGCVGALVMIRRVLRNPFMILTLFTSVLYLALLSFRLYGSYKLTGEPVAINGRYLLPLLPPIIATLICATVWLTTKLHIHKYLPVIASAILATLIFSGGGILTYIILAEPQWYW